MAEKEKLSFTSDGEGKRSLKCWGFTMENMTGKSSISLTGRRRGKQ